MSAESNEAKPSIDDILSSIRQMIAEENTASDSSETPADSIPRHATNSNGRNGSATEGAASQPAEDVLDLSEEFIVTEAAAAVRREQQRHAEDEQTAAPEPAADAADPQPGEPGDRAVETSEEGGEAGEASEEEDAAQVAPENVWSQDFQMPVGENGPASPFTAARAHPESAWPSNESFDVTELYSRARSSAPYGRGAQASGDREPEEDTDEAEGDVKAESAGAEEPVQPQDMDEVGVELASLSLTPDAVDDDHPGADDAEDSEGELMGSEMTPPTETVRRIHAAEEIEAAFGMPPRGLANPSEPEALSELEQPKQADSEPLEAFDEDLKRDTLAEAYDEAGIGQVGVGAPDPAHDDAQEVGTPETEHQASDAARTQPATAGPDALGAAAMPGSGKSLEDSVKELLRPMLQEWLDKNMPRLVEAAMREQMAAASREGGPDDADGGDGDVPPHDRKFGTER